MEFLEINFTKDASLLLRCIHSPFCWRIWKKTILYSGFNNPYKKNPRNKKTRKNEGRIPDKNLSLRRPEFMPRNSVQEFYLCTRRRCMRTETRRVDAGTRGQRTTRVCTVNRSRTAAILVSSNQVHFVFRIRIRNNSKILLCRPVRS
jgi:hypothetical protein